jgi:hypothetical protein
MIELPYAGRYDITKRNVNKIYFPTLITLYLSKTSAPQIQMSRSRGIAALLSFKLKYLKIARWETYPQNKYN